jgi:uncharacterized hydrophobic protein (TIGR00271 family)
VQPDVTSTPSTPVESPPVPARSSRFRSREDIYQDIYESRQFNLTYFLMLVMACLIALLGLLENSPAVIIGAMLISPLMWPILSCGLALTSADWPLGKKALRNVGFSILETIFIAMLATWLMPLKSATPEILARTSPNLMDLLIAMFSGFAGTLAICSSQGGLTILPGVAIAVAVMPPLATIGYGISTHQWGIARGSFLLFFTNLMAIVISANVVFFFMGFRPRRKPLGAGRHLLFRYRVPLAWLILIVLSVPLMQTLIRAARQVSLRNEIASSLNEHLEHTDKAQLSAFNLHRQGDMLAVDATVRTAVFIKPERIKELEVALSARLGRSVKLRVDQVQLAKDEPPAAPPPGSRNYLTAGVVRPLGTDGTLESAAAILSDAQEKIEKMLVALLVPMKVDGPTIHSLARENDTIVIEVRGSELTATDAAGWTVAAAALADRVAAPVRLEGKIVIGDQPLSMGFRRRSSIPLTQSLRQLRQLAKTWQARPDVVFELTVSGAAGSTVTNRRLALLKRELKGKVDNISPPDPELDADHVQVVAVQIIDVAGNTPTSEKK